MVLLTTQRRIVEEEPQTTEETDAESVADTCAAAAVRAGTRWVQGFAPTPPGERIKIRRGK